MTPPAKNPFLSPVHQTRLIGLFIALSLSVTYFYLIKPWAMGVPGNSTNFWVFSATSHANNHLSSLYEVWRPRIGGLWLSGRMVDSIVKDGLINLQDYQSNNIVVFNVEKQEGQQVFGHYLYTEDYRNIFGLYHACWLFLFFVMLLFMAEDPVFVIFACFAGLFYMLTPRAVYYAYPWDMPSMTFFTLGYLLWLKKHYRWMLVIIFFGTLFKETAAVTAVLFFFTDLNWKKRIVYFGIAFLSTLLLKIAITSVIDGRIEILTQDLTRGNSSGKLMTLWSNLQELAGPKWNHFVFVNAGTFVIALFLPMRTKIEMGTKVVLLLFFCGQMLAGSLSEFRVMLEVLPVSVLYLRQTLEGWKVKMPLIRDTENKPPGTLKKKPRP